MATTTATINISRDIHSYPITISKTIGRVIRKGNEQKVYGLVVVPSYDKVGISASKRVNAVVDTIFNKGLPAISITNK